MPRFHKDFIKAYMDYAQYSEAPKHMHFWTGVSVVAGALRRKVWFDQAYFRWYPNFYIILVAPPGVVQKSTTAGIGMSLLKQVPGINFGPDVVTWPALVTAMAAIGEGYEVGDMIHTMAALTIASSEFGNLLNPQDTEMVDLLVKLWDSEPGPFKKATKNSGNDTIENPWLNLIACTTPSWIAGNFPEYMIGGGFTSRCIFVYADQKAKYVAYPRLSVPKDLARMQSELISDLTQISMIAGEMEISPEAVAWGNEWYEKNFTERPVNLDDDRFGGYVSRKQTHVHKLAMILSASEGDKRLIEVEHLQTAVTMITDLEPDMAMVFAKIGKTEASFYADRMVQYVARRGETPYMEVYRYVHSHFPSMRDFEDVLAGCVRAGMLKIIQSGDKVMILPGLNPTVPA